MSNVIPQIGQVWTFEDSRESYDSKLLKITDRDDHYNTLHFENGVEVSEKLAITGKIRFKPSTDLEWLAVNEPIWGTSRIDFNIAKRGEGFVYGDYRYLCGGYTRQEHQDKRNELYFAAKDVHISNKNKPLIYTKEMSLSNTLPLIGMHFRVEGDEHCDDGYFYIKCVANHPDGGIIAEDELGRFHLVTEGFMEL